MKSFKVTLFLLGESSEEVVCFSKAEAEAEKHRILSNIPAPLSLTMSPVVEIEEAMTAVA